MTAVCRIKTKNLSNILVNYSYPTKFMVKNFSAELKKAETKKGQPEEALQHYLKAESIYRGDFLAETPYEDWCLQHREHFKTQFLDLLVKLLKSHETINDYDRCITLANTYLEQDPYSEEIYKALMGYYATKGNLAMATLTFEKCREFIIEDLGCPLNKETESFYNEILSGQTHS